MWRGYIGYGIIFQGWLTFACEMVTHLLRLQTGSHTVNRISYDMFK